MPSLRRSVSPGIRGDVGGIRKSSQTPRRNERLVADSCEAQVSASTDPCGDLLNPRALTSSHTRSGRESLSSVFGGAPCDTGHKAQWAGTVLQPRGRRGGGVTKHLPAGVVVSPPGGGVSAPTASSSGVSGERDVHRGVAARSKVERPVGADHFRPRLAPPAHGGRGLLGTTRNRNEFLL